LSYDPDVWIGRGVVGLGRDVELRQLSVGEPSRIFIRESDGDGVGDANLVGAGDLLV
jgi:hypothetical protein